MFIILLHIVIYTFGLLGIYVAGSQLLTALYAKLFYSKPEDFMTTYRGQGSYALITGGSDGIGLGFTEQFALRGFNCVILARTESKLIALCDRLKKQYPNQDFKYLAMDFSAGTTIEFFQPIFDMCKDLDVSILVNNVGHANTNPITEQTEKGLLGDSTTSVNAQAVLTAHFLPKFLKRKEDLKCEKGGAIIALSSIASIFPSAFGPLYEACKIFNRVLNNKVNYHCSKDIDVLSITPGFVDTPLTGHMPISDKVASVEDCVYHSLCHLGRRVESVGSWKHQKMVWLMRGLTYIIPESIMINFAMKIIQRVQARRKKMRDNLMQKKTD